MRENHSPAGEQAAQSIPLLVVPTTRDSMRAQYYCGQIVYVPEVGNMVITEEQIMQAEVLKITGGQLLEIEPMHVLQRRKQNGNMSGANLWSSQTRSRSSQRECMNCINGTWTLPRVPIESPSWWKSRRIITTIRKLWPLSIMNCFSYTIKTRSTNLSSVAIVCKWFLFVI